MPSTITITDSATTATIDIEGIIGVARQQEGKVASYTEFESTLEKIKSINAKEIVVNIRSMGGNVNDALLIYDSLCELDAMITTRCFGYVASAATIIAQAADKDRREISANSLYLIHCSESVCEGNAKTIVLTKELLEQTDLRIADIYAFRSGKRAESFYSLMNENEGRGRWLSPKETLKAGLADKIISSAPISNLSQSEIAQLGLPPIPVRQRSAYGRMIRNLTKCLTEILDMLGLVVDKDIDKVPIPEPYSAHNKVNNEQNEIDKTVLIQSQNDNRNASATQTKQKEDPSIYEPVRTSNMAAYDADAENIKTRTDNI